MFEWYRKVINQYADFRGRARRSEYWYFWLVNAIIVCGLTLVSSVFNGGDFSQMSMAQMSVLGLYNLFIIIPTLAVQVRRLHDTSRSGWWLLIGLIPLVGFIILVVFYIQDSTPGSNKWGPNPKEEYSDDLSHHLVD